MVLTCKNYTVRRYEEGFHSIDLCEAFKLLSDNLEMQWTTLTETAI